MFARWEATLDGILAKLQGQAVDRPRLDRLDAILTAVCGLAAIAIAWWCARQLGDVLYTEGSFNLWFQADNPRVVANLLNPASDQYRANVHPIFPIVTTPWISLLPGLGIPPLAVAKGVVFACAAGSAAAVFLALRLMELSRVAALVFTGLFLSSAGFLHWYSVIEIAAFNGLSTSLAVLALAYGPTRRKAGWVLMSAFALGMTITNWSAGLAATIARFSLRPAVVISTLALVVVGVLAVGQRLVYPTAGVFFNPRGIARESAYAAPQIAEYSALANLRSALIYTVVAPPPVLERQDTSRVVTNQQQGFAGMMPLGLAAAAGWILLLGGGAVAAARRRRLQPIALGLGLMTAAQVVLALVYGDVTFLYATNILPMLVVTAAFAWTGRPRVPVLFLAGAVALFAAANNVPTFQRASELARGVIADGGNPVYFRYKADGFVLPVPQPKVAP